MTEWQQTGGCIILLIGIMIAGTIALLMTQPHGRPADYLIGKGCGPNEETMVAAEEDHFPRCRTIERNPAYD